MSDFTQLLETEIPRLRRYARALTRDSSRADDLVQNCLVRAIAKEHLWQPGTDLRAWLITILHNQHVNDVRRSVREGVCFPVEDGPILTVPPNAAASLQLRDLERAIATLPEEQRQVILLVGLEGMRLRAGCRDPPCPDRHNSLAFVAWPGDVAPEVGYRTGGGRGVPVDAALPAVRLAPLDPTSGPTNPS